MILLFFVKNLALRRCYYYFLMNICFFLNAKKSHVQKNAFFSKEQIHAAEGSASLSGGNLVDGLPPVLSQPSCNCEVTRRALL